jgi:hypothetical protein
VTVVVVVAVVVFMALWFGFRWLYDAVNTTDVNRSLPGYPMPEPPPLPGRMKPCTHGPCSPCVGHTTEGKS